MEPTSVSAPQAPSWKDVGKNLAFLAVTIGFFYWLTVRIGIEDVRATVEQSGALAPLIVIALKATTLVVVPLGGTPLYPLAGALFGFWKGLFIALLGDVIGSTICFYLSRFFGRSILRFFMSREHLPTVEKLVASMAERRTFVKAKLFFAGFPELFAYAAGLTAIPYLFFITVHIGVHALSASLLVLFGDAIVSGSAKAIGIAWVATSGLAFAGIWWFHKNIAAQERAAGEQEVR